MAAAGEVFRRSLPEKACEELHVLAVDDSLVDRKVIENLLRRLSCKVTAVDSASRALQFLGLDGEKRSNGLVVEEIKVNLIMTDYSMPGMSGYELLKKIKESAALREIPVVIMSSERVLARIDRCLEEGAEEFLSKPVQFSDVKRLRDFVVCGGRRTAVKRSREEDEDSLLLMATSCSNPPSKHYDRSDKHHPSDGGSLPTTAVAVISPKRVKVKSKE